MTETKWIVWSNEHKMWWRANNNGYTDYYEDAGRYTYDEAVMICAGANWGCHGSVEKRGAPYETMIPEGCYGMENNIRHPKEVSA